MKEYLDFFDEVMGRKEVVRIGTIEVNVMNGTIYEADQPVNRLSPVELNTLLILGLTSIDNIPMSIADFAALGMIQCRSYDFDVDGKQVGVSIGVARERIANLRKQLPNPKMIITEHGFGYLIKDND